MGTNALKAPALRIMFFSGLVAGAISLMPAVGFGDSSDSVDALKTDVDVSGPFLQRLADQNKGDWGDQWHGRKNPIRCGEPEITHTLQQPNVLFMNCTPDATLSYQTPQPVPYFQWTYTDPLTTNIATPCFLFRSDDGGNRWKTVDPNPMRPDLGYLCADAMAEHGPNGELYLAADIFHSPPNAPVPIYVTPPLLPLPMQPLGIGFTRSLDGGRTWSTPIFIPTAIDGPVFTVDHSTGVLYEASSCVNFNLTTGIGDYGCTPTARNLAVSTDRGQTWLPAVEIATTNPPTTTITPGHLHNIAPLGTSRNGLSAALGVLGAVGASGPGAVVFGYSTDNGATFTQHPIPLGTAIPCAAPQPEVAADPAARGTFAVDIICVPSAPTVRVFVTHDFGVTWTETADLAVVPPPDFQGTASPYTVNRPWINYSPTGVLGVVWREDYGPTQQPFGLAAPVGERLLAQDVFIALSTDGGTTFGSPIRVNTATSPGGDPRQIAIDDDSHILLDQQFAYVGWGDWRSGEMEIWFRKVDIH